MLRSLAAAVLIGCNSDLDISTLNTSTPFDEITGDFAGIRATDDQKIAEEILRNTGTKLAEWADSLLEAPGQQQVIIDGTGPDLRVEVLSMNDAAFLQGSQFIFEGNGTAPSQWTVNQIRFPAPIEIEDSVSGKVSWRKPVDPNAEVLASSEGENVTSPQN